MIASVQAIYSGTKNHIEVAAHILEDDGETSMHRLLDTATVWLMHDHHDMISITFDKRAYNAKRNKYHLFILNPPIQKSMRVRMEVTLFDGRTAKDQTIVYAEDVLTNPDQLTNPVLAGRQETNFANEPGVELL